MNNDDDIRTLLDEAVSDVEPRDRLDAIRSKTKVTTMRTRRNWLLGAGAAVVATAATIAAVTMLGNAPGTTDANDHVAGQPTATASATDTPTDTPSSSAPAGPAAVAVPVYYVGDTSHGPRLYREFHRGPTAGGPLIEALEQAIGTAPDDPDYTSPWPEGTELSHAEQQSDLLIVDLSGDVHDRPAGMTEETARMAVQQLMYTAQAATQTRLPVQFLIDGQHTDQLLGQPASEPLAQGSADQVLAQVWIIEPAEGATVKSGFTVSGLAAAFEANVQWELKQGDTVVKDGFTTAEECCTMAPYSFTVEAPPGAYTLVVHDSDPSGGEGLAPWQDTKNLTITR